jgi:hypothetical protein
MSLKSLAKTGLLAAVSKLTGRHRPPSAGGSRRESLLSLSHPTVWKAPFGEPVETNSGNLRITLLGYEDTSPKDPLGDGRPLRSTTGPLARFANG